MLDMVDEYLTLNQDEDKEILAFSGENGDRYEHKKVVKIPTIQGLARFLGITKETLYKWAVDNEQLSDSLAKVKTEQHDRLINNGLSGDYNSTIAKLVLSSNHGYAEKEEHKLEGEFSLTNILNDLAKNEIDKDN